MDYKALEQKIINSYVEGVTTQQAENLAGEFLEAQIKASEEIKNLDLTARIYKAKLKETRSEVFVEKATEGEKKPSDTLLNAFVDVNEQVKTLQLEYDESEVDKDEIQRMFGIFKDAHLHFRAISKGKFD